jgi:threonine/homoserine/homoserine lactone efflux protein
MGRQDLTRAFLSTFVLTLTNPLTILSFAAVFAGLGLGSAAGGYADGVVLVIGVFAGSALWWLLLSSSFGLFRGRIGQGGVLWVNRLSGGLIVAFGLGATVGGAAALFR